MPYISHVSWLSRLCRQTISEVHRATLDFIWPCTSTSKTLLTIELQNQPQYFVCCAASPSSLQIQSKTINQIDKLHSRFSVYEIIAGHKYQWMNVDGWITLSLRAVSFKHTILKKIKCSLISWLRTWPACYHICSELFHRNKPSQGGVGEPPMFNTIQHMVKSFLPLKISSFDWHLVCMLPAESALSANILVPCRFYRHSEAEDWWTSYWSLTALVVGLHTRRDRPGEHQKRPFSNPWLLSPPSSSSRRHGSEWKDWQTELRRWCWANNWEGSIHGAKTMDKWQVLFGFSKHREHEYRYQVGFMTKAEGSEGRWSLHRRNDCLKCRRDHIWHFSVLPSLKEILVHDTLLSTVLLLNMRLMLRQFRTRLYSWTWK